MHHFPFWRPALWVLFLLWLPFGAQASQEQDTTRLNTLLGQAWSMMYRAPDSALLLCHEALEFAESKDLDAWTAKSENQIGVVYWVKSEHDSALVWLEKAFDGYAALEDEFGMGRVANNFGITYLAMDYYELAMQSFQDALPVVKKIGKPVQLATIYNNLGMVTNSIGNEEESIKYFSEAHSIFKEHPEAGDTALTHNNIGLAYRDIKDFEAARFHLGNSVSGYREQEKFLNLVEALYNFGGLLLIQDSLDKADEYYQEALGIAREYDNSYLQGTSWLNIAELRLSQGRETEAVTAADSALHFLSPSHGLRPRKAIFEVLAEAEAKGGNYQLAYQYARKINVLEDSLLNAEMVRNINELTHKYESEIKDKEIMNLQQQRILSRWQKGGLIVIIVLVLIIFVVVVRRQRAIIRREKALQEKTRLKYLLIMHVYNWKISSHCVMPTN